MSESADLSLNGEDQRRKVREDERCGAKTVGKISPGLIEGHGDQSEEDGLTRVRNRQDKQVACEASCRIIDPIDAQLFFIIDEIIHYTSLDIR